MNDIDADVRVSGLFYKYRDFPNDADAERWQWLEDTLLRRRVFFPSPSVLNDPFDCYPRIDVPADETEFRAKATDLLVDVYRGRGRIITDDIRNGTLFQGDVTELIIKLRKDEFRNQTLYDSINENSGVYCMSRIGSSVLQWSYYGGGHSGFCMEFAVPKDATPPFDQVVGMEYVADRQGIDLFDVIGPGNVNHIWKMVRKKFSDWSHEDEVRAFMPKPGVFEIQPHVLTSIIFGIKATEKHMQTVRDLVTRGWSNVAYHQARQSSNHYAIEIDRLP